MAIGCTLLAAIAFACATRPEREIVLFVGTSGDYAPFSFVEASDGAEAFRGFAPAVARAYAADRGFSVRFVRFEWPDLLDDLAAERFEVAMSGVTVRPERSIAGRFSLPVATSGAVVLTRVRPGGRAPKTLAAVDRKNAPIAVNAGGHLERVARQHLTNATIVPIEDNRGVYEALASGQFETVVTDTQEAPHWKRELEGIHQIGPFTQDRKAFLVRTDLPELASDLDAWIVENEANGRMEVLRDIHLGSDARVPELGYALTALLAKIDERLALMPAVAEAKRRDGIAVEAPDREAIVLDAAVDAALAAAHARELPPPAAGTLRELFRAQIEAAKAIQYATLESPPSPDVPVADLASELRPALIRIGEQIALLAVLPPPELREHAFIEGTRRALSARNLDDAHLARIAAALIRLANDPRRTD